MQEGEIGLKEVGPETVAFVAREGPYSQMLEAMGEVMALVQELGLTMEGPPGGVYYNSPGEVPEEELLWEVRIPVAEGAEDEGIKTREAREVAATVHSGSYHEIGASYDALRRWIEAQGYQIAGPAEEIYLNNPQEVPPEELLTEVRLPVAKS